MPLDSPLFAGGAVLAVPVLSFRVAGERVPVVPGVTVLGAICVGRMGRAEHYVVAADGPALPRYPLPKFTFAVEMDDVLLPGSQIAHSARNGQALKRCHLTGCPRSELPRRGLTVTPSWMESGIDCNCLQHG